MKRIYKWGQNNKKKKLDKGVSHKWSYVQTFHTYHTSDNAHSWVYVFFVYVFKMIEQRFAYICKKLIQNAYTSIQSLNVKY